jgi:uncharacterized membrane protein
VGNKVILVVSGILILIFGLFLTLGILISSLKENDNEDFYSFLISISAIIAGIYFIVKGIKKTN